MSDLKTQISKRLKSVLQQERAQFEAEQKAREARIASDAAKEEANALALAEAEQAAENIRKLVADASKLETALARIGAFELGEEGDGADRARWLAKADLTLRAIDRATSTDSIAPYWNLPGDWSRESVSAARLSPPNELHLAAVVAVKRLALEVSSKEERDAAQAKQEAKQQALEALIEKQMQEAEAEYEANAELIQRLEG